VGGGLNVKGGIDVRKHVDAMIYRKKR